MEHGEKQSLLLGFPTLLDIRKFRLDKHFLECGWHLCDSKRPRCPVSGPLGFIGRPLAKNEYEGSKRDRALYSGQCHHLLRNQLWV